MLNFGIRTTILLSALLGFSACVRPALQSAPQRLSPMAVIYLANRGGEIEPCGCQVNQIGGLHRLETFLNQFRTQSKIDFIGDAGDTFFVSAQLNPSRIEEAKLKAMLIAKIYPILGVDAVTPGEKDFALGVEFLKELALVTKSQFLSANLTDAQGKLLFAPHHLFERHGNRIGVVGISDEDAFAQVPGVKVLPAKPALIRAIEELKSVGVDKLIVLSHSGLSKDRDLAKEEGIDLIFGAHSLDVISSPGGAPWIVQPLNEGQQVGVIQFHSNGLEREHRLVNLGKEYEGENQTLEMMRAHREAVRKLGLEKGDQRAFVESSEAFTASPTECRICHQKQYDFWAETKHASAYLVLYAKNQHFDPECVTCHTLGFDDKRGFRDIAAPIVVTGRKRGFVEIMMKSVFRNDSKKPLDSREDPVRYEKLKRAYHRELKKIENSGKLSKNFLGVQCEHCHGNRHGHPGQANTLKKVQESSCKACHVPPHSRPFDVTSFSKVSCPLSSRE